MVSEEKIFEKVYDVRRRRTPSDGKGPSELKSSSLCLYTSNLGTFWLKIEQVWPFEEIFIFNNGGHLG